MPMLGVRSRPPAMSRVRSAETVDASTAHDTSDTHLACATLRRAPAERGVRGRTPQAGHVDATRRDGRPARARTQRNVTLAVQLHSIKPFQQQLDGDLCVI